MTTTTTHDVPREMKAAAVEKKGAPVATKTMPVPKLGNDEVLVRVDVAGVGAWDPALVSGEFSDRKTKHPHVYGAEGAGTVVAVGKSVTRAKVGDLVYGYGFGNAKGGFFAEYTALPETNIAPLPPGLTSESAGALAVSGLTALKGLELLDFDDGEPILIIGASGGVGHIAIQLAKRMGARVLAVVSGSDGVALARRLGADEVVDGKGDELKAAVQAFAPEGFEGALVLAGGDGGFQEILADVEGVVAHPNGVPRPAAADDSDVKAYDGEVSAGALDRLNELINKGPFFVELSATYDLDEADRAVHDVAEHHVGKIAIKVH